MRKLLFALVLVLGPASAHAQTGACPASAALAVNPSGWVCLTPGSDYNDLWPNPPVAGVPSVPVVVRIDLLLFAPSVTDTATQAPTLTVALGKPTVNAQGAVWAQANALTTLPLNAVYRARVVAVGQPLTAGGAAQVSARSPESNPFLRLGPAPAPAAPTLVRVPE